MTIPQLETMADPAYPVDHQRINLSDLEAEEFTYVMSTTGLDGNLISILSKKYLIMDGSAQYAVTILTPLELQDFYSDTFDEIGKSFKLLNENN